MGNRGSVPVLRLSRRRLSARQRPTRSGRVACRPGDRPGLQSQGWLEHVPRRLGAGLPRASASRLRNRHVVRKGLVDHADSLGAAARYGEGDVQWLTTGRGVVHSEMFPLLDDVEPNPLELFQIWLNLPAASKMSAPHFTMFWSEDYSATHGDGRPGATTEIAVIAGRAAGRQRARSTTASCSRSRRRRIPGRRAREADIAIWTIRMSPGARWTVPAANAGTRRNLYLFKGGPVDCRRRGSARTFRHRSPCGRADGARQRRIDERVPAAAGKADRRAGRAARARSS